MAKPMCVLFAHHLYMHHLTLLLGSLHLSYFKSKFPPYFMYLRRSRVHSLMVARRSLCPEKLGSNPGPDSKGMNVSGWHGLDMSITVTKRR